MVAYVRTYVTYHGMHIYFLVMVTMTMPDYKRIKQFPIDNLCSYNKPQQLLRSVAPSRTLMASATKETGMLYNLIKMYT